MWLVKNHVTTPLCVAMATSAASSSATSCCQCVGRVPGMLLEDVFEPFFPNLVYQQLEAQWLNVHKRS